MGIQAVIVDTAGTTTDYDFIKKVLFSYSAKEMARFIEENQEQVVVSHCIDDVKELAGEPDADLARVVEILLQWIAEDQKATPLKTIQGMIWRQGYRQGDLEGHIYPDALESLKSLKAQGKRIYSFSSSSTEAQELLFQHSQFGDLRNLFHGHFDTHMGQKVEPQAYRNIINTISMWPNLILFVSDRLEELNAAKAAGLKTCQIVRSEGIRQGKHPVIQEFSQLNLESF
ncbi:acireductone synthase [Ferrimonas sediminicola]|uniref:Enolase-phosphatase E1 n=1 Tax=Ferrimonas sediminicola TaxID=2569538 RepID=A0A4U1B6W6_9GAMM|nr:acireductone synthase [Ferrimonas sediminicola]TKB46228.1 acireductone synthase [Ferrimonas sediminicola]